MSFFQDIFSTARNIVNKGKDVLADQLSSGPIVYEKGKGITSTSSNTPKIIKTGKEFLFPSRGFSDQQIKDAKYNTKDTVIGIAKTAGEIVQGGVDIVSGLGNLIASPILPGAVANSRQYKRQLNTKVSEKLAPTNASQAKAMRGGDILGLIPIGSVSKLSKLDRLSDIVRNSLKTEKLGVRENSLKYFRENPDQIKTGEVRLRELEDGSVFIEDGRHRLEVGREKGITPNLVDVTAEYTGKPSAKIESIINDIKSTPDVPVKTANLDKGPVAKVTETAPKKITKVTDEVVDTLPRTADGEVDAFKYADLQNAARESARETRTIGDKLASAKNEIFDKMVDFTGPIQRAYKKGLKTDKKFAASQVDKVNVDDYVDRVFNAPAITTGFIKEKGFNDVVQAVGNDKLGYFDQYLIARRAQDLRARGINTGRDTEKLVKADQAILKQMGPQFEEQAKKIDGFVQARLDYMVESGLLSPQQAKTLREVDPRYVPFQRTFTEDELMSMGGTNGSRGVASNSGTGIEKMTGSARQIESPLESLLATTEQMVVRAEKNKAAQTIASYKDIEGNPFGLRQVKKTTDAEKGKDTISFFVDGKKQIWEVNSDIAKAAKALDVQRLNIFGQILAAPLRVARVGITGIAPGFVAKNVVRDQVSAFVLSDNGLRSSVANPRVFGAGLAEALKHGKLYDEIVGQGALMTSVDYTRNAIKPTLQQIAESNSKFNNVVYNAKNPSKWFRGLENIVSRSEEVTRIQQYKGAYEAAISRGVDPKTAKILASRAARENSTNFARRGEWGTVMNNAFLYINAGIQGSRRMIRAFQKAPKETAAKVALTYGMPAAAFTYWNLSDPDRKAVYDDLQDWEKETSMIIIPPNPTKDENGRWNVIKIPLQPGMGEFANAPRRAIEASYGGDPVGFGEAAARMLAVVQPVNTQNPLSQAVPQAIKPAIEVATNKNLFTGAPIVPRNLENLDPSVQYFSKQEGSAKNTSGTAKLIADTAGISPIKTEHFLNSTFGSVSRNVLNASDKALAKTGAIDPNQIGGESATESVAKGFSSAAGGKKENSVLEQIYQSSNEAKTKSEVLKREAYKIYQSLADLPAAEANAQLKQINAENPALFQKIKDAKESIELNLTREEKALKQAPVSDGTRAQLIFDRAKQIREAEGAAAANAYIADLREKRVISKEVLKQIKELNQQ